MRCNAALLVLNAAESEDGGRIAGQKLHEPDGTILHDGADLAAGHADNQAPIGEFLLVRQVGSDRPAGDIVNGAPLDFAPIGRKAGKHQKVPHLRDMRGLRWTSTKRRELRPGIDIDDLWSIIDV